MVHVRKCPCKNGRGKPSTEFHIDGKPQIYCCGWIDLHIDEPLECCMNCKDWASGEQPQLDLDMHNVRTGNTEHMTKEYIDYIKKLMNE